MAKDPAFLFYYDRFMSGTYTMTHEEVGAYIRLLCIQANNGYLTEKDMNNTSYSSVKDIFNKFTEVSPGIFRNQVLHEIMEDRKKFTQSRRTNRLGKKRTENTKELVNNTSYSSEKLVVNVNKDLIIDKNEVDFSKLELGSGEMELARLSIKGEKGFMPEDKPIHDAFKLFRGMHAEDAYPSKSEFYKHFYNWVKKQTFTPSTKMEAWRAI